MADRRRDRGTRAQAHTLEGLVAALLVLASVLFALQSTAVTPLSASTSNQHIENQQRAMGADVLATAAANGTLTDAVVFWNRSADGFVGSDGEPYHDGGPPNQFGHALNETFFDERVAFNVVVAYHEQGGGIQTQRMVYMGNPTDNAVRVGRSVVLTDDTELVGSAGNVSAAAAAGEFYAPDVSGDKLFNVVEVRLIAWRI
ncbi:MAG: hypothetical protein ABEJ08_03975 [Halobacteriaceae archaeon]